MDCSYEYRKPNPKSFLFRVEESNISDLHITIIFILIVTVSQYEEIITQNISLNMPQNVNVKKKHNGMSYLSRLSLLCCHICSIGLVCNAHGSRCCFLCFCKWTNTLCFGQHHTKVICNILHCMMGFFQITMLSILWIFFHLPRKHCDVSDAITDVHTWNISPSMVNKLYPGIV